MTPETADILRQGQDAFFAEPPDMVSARQRFEKVTSLAPACSDVAVIANPAFSTWSTVDDDWTTTRGKVRSWEKFDFPTWSELTSDLSTLSFPAGCHGWLFFDSGGPYFRPGSAVFHEWLDLIADDGISEGFPRSGRGFAGRIAV